MNIYLIYENIECGTNLSIEIKNLLNKISSQNERSKWRHWIYRFQLNSLNTKPFILILNFDYVAKIIIVAKLLNIGCLSSIDLPLNGTTNGYNIDLLRKHKLCSITEIINRLIRYAVNVASKVLLRLINWIILPNYCSSCIYNYSFFFELLSIQLAHARVNIIHVSIWLSTASTSCESLYYKFIYIQITHEMKIKYSVHMSLTSSSNCYVYQGKQMSISMNLAW